MPLLIAAIGIVFFVAALRGQTSTLFELLHNDFAGKGNFLVWMGAILGLGLFGYIKQVRPIAGGFLVLVMLSLVLSNKGFFANFAQAFEATQQTPAETVSASATSASGGTSTSGVPASLSSGLSSAETAINSEANAFSSGQLFSGSTALNSLFGGSSSTLNAGSTTDLVNDLF